MGVNGGVGGKHVGLVDLDAILRLGKPAVEVMVGPGGGGRRLGQLAVLAGGEGGGGHRAAHGVQGDGKGLIFGKDKGAEPVDGKPGHPLAAVLEAVGGNQIPGHAVRAEMQNLQLGMIDAVRHRHGDLDGYQQRAVGIGVYRVPQGQVHLHILPVGVGNLQLLRWFRNRKGRGCQIFGAEARAHNRDLGGLHTQRGVIDRHLSCQSQLFLQLPELGGHAGTLLVGGEGLLQLFLVQIPHRINGSLLCVLTGIGVKAVEDIPQAVGNLPRGARHRPGLAPFRPIAVIFLRDVPGDHPDTEHIVPRTKLGHPVIEPLQEGLVAATLGVLGRIRLVPDFPVRSVLLDLGKLDEEICVVRQNRFLQCVGKIGPIPAHPGGHGIGNAGIGILVYRGGSGITVGIGGSVVAQIGDSSSIGTGWHLLLRIPAHIDLLDRSGISPKPVAVDLKDLTGVRVCDFHLIVWHDVLGDVFQHHLPGLELPAAQFGILGQPLHLRSRQLGRRGGRRQAGDQGEQHGRNQGRAVPSFTHTLSSLSGNMVIRSIARSGQNFHMLDA